MDISNFAEDETSQHLNEVGDLNEADYPHTKGFDANVNDPDGFATQQYGDTEEVSVSEEHVQYETEEMEESNPEFQADQSFSNEESVSFEETISTDQQESSEYTMEDSGDADNLVTQTFHEVENAEELYADNVPQRGSEEDASEFSEANTTGEDPSETIVDEEDQDYSSEEKSAEYDEDQEDANVEEEEYIEDSEEVIAEDGIIPARDEELDSNIAGEESLDAEDDSFIESTAEEVLQGEEDALLEEEIPQVQQEDNGEVYDADDMKHQEEEVAQEENPSNLQEESYEEVYYENNEGSDDIIQEQQEVEVEDSADNEYEVESEAVEDARQEAEGVSNQEEMQQDSVTSPSEEISGTFEESGAKDVSDHQDNDYEDDVVEEEDQTNDDVDENVAEHESGSENEQEEVTEVSKLNKADDYDVSDSDPDEISTSASLAKDEAKPAQEAAAKMLESDSEDDEEKEGDLIADIFGKSDDEDEEFAGFGGEEDAAASMKKSLAAVISDSDEDEPDDIPQKKRPGKDESSSDEGIQDAGKSSEMVYDFDIMLKKKKEERRGRRKRDGGTFISDADDIINAMLTKMKEAAEADREANRLKKPALSKLKMLGTVVRHLRKQDLKEAFVDMGVIPAIADWLSLLPDKSLPHITIRSELLDILHDLPPLIPETLKTSGIGRAVMMVFKHPKEIRRNKDSAGRLINKWTRPIFGLNDNFKSMSRGEREQRDLEQMPQAKRRRLSSGRGAGEKGEEEVSEPGQLRPGERGFVMRARVPKPSNKDYVIRPKWNVDMDDEEGSSRMQKRTKSRKDERLEKHLKTFADRKKNLKMQRAVGISLEGNKMPLS